MSLRQKKIPVYILSGFLGSGKTTILLRLLEESKQRGLRPGIVLNELGEINVEKNLFADQPMIELLNGCICCTIQEDLTRELYTFLSGVASDSTTIPDILFIEGTGVAHPLEIIDGLTHPHLLDWLEIQSLISVIDGSRYLDLQSIFSSSKEIRTLLKEQVSYTPLLVLNKMDLLSPKQVEKVKTKLRAHLHPQTKLIETAFGQAPMEELLKSRWQAWEIDTQKEPENGSHDQHHRSEHHQQHGQEKHHHHSLFQTMTLKPLPPLDQKKLKNWLHQLPATMLRAKGIIQLVDQAGLFQMQYASGQMTLKPVGELTDISTCIILIGSHLDHESIQQSFNEMEGLA